MLVRLTQDRFFQLIKNKSIQNFIFLLIIQSSNVLISLISMPLLIHAIGVEQFGLVSLALSVVFLVNVWVSYGYNLSGPREIAINQGDHHALSRITSKILFAKVLLAIAAGSILIVLIYGFGFFSEYKVILLFSIMLLFSEATTSTWFFQGMERMKMVSIANVAGKLLYLFALVLFVNSPGDAKWANFYLGATALGINVLLLVYMNSSLNIPLLIPRLKELLDSWRENFVLFLSGMAAHVSAYGGLIILSFFANASVLGMYSMAERVGIVLRMFPSLVTQAVYPNASKLYLGNIELFYGFVRKVYWVALGVSLIITLTVIVFAPQIIRMLSGSDYESSILFLRILSFVPLVASLNIANMIIILVADRKRLLFRSTWLTCCYMMVAAVVLTYFFGGKGLAYSLVSTELIIFGVCSALLQRKNPEIFNGFYGRAFSGHYSG